VVEEVDGPDGIDVILDNGAIGFSRGVRDVLFGPVELKLAGDEDGGLVELFGLDAAPRRRQPQVPAVRHPQL
jgi:hypothetical protein